MNDKHIKELLNELYGCNTQSDIKMIDIYGYSYLNHIYPIVYRVCGANDMIDTDNLKKIRRCKYEYKR